MALNICNKIKCDTLFSENTGLSGSSLLLARFDLVHPHVSGNKLYKLHFFIEDARAQNASHIFSFGGAFSNHLVATAAFCNTKKLSCTGFVRGERPAHLSYALQLCEQMGMRLQFMPRAEYDSVKYTSGAHNDGYYIPEGGYHPLGAQGAALMWDAIQHIQPTHLVTAVGSATTLAGLLSKSTVPVIAAPVIKQMADIPDRLNFLLKDFISPEPIIWEDVHGGGFAKTTPELLHFMDDFKNRFNIELDKIYTAKMMRGALQRFQNAYFPEGSKVVCLHTGGLTGNL